MTDYTTRIGIFGGTFDPPHLGHLVLAAEACSQLGLDRLFWLITPDPPHKESRFISSIATRLELLSAALSEARGYEISTVDVDRPGPQYAVDTMDIFREAHPQTELVYLMGADSLTHLDQWHRPGDFIAKCDAIGVMHRPGEQVDLEKTESMFPGISTKLRWIKAPLLEISSRQIRQRIREGRPYRYFLSPEVYALIEEKQLYRSAGLTD